MNEKYTSQLIKTLYFHKELAICYLWIFRVNKKRGIPPARDSPNKIIKCWKPLTLILKNLNSF